MKDLSCNLINKLKNILTRHKLSPVVSTSISNHQIINMLDAKVDSGASKHFFKANHIKYLRNAQKLYDRPIAAQLPNNMIVQATHKGLIDLYKDLSKKASEV